MAARRRPDDGRWDRFFSMARRKGELEAEPLEGLFRSDQDADDLVRSLADRVLPPSRQVWKMAPHIPVVIKSLKLGNNKLGNSGIRTLMNSLTASRVSVKKLWLQGNLISGDGAFHVAEYIKTSLYPIEELHLSHNLLGRGDVLSLLTAAAERYEYPLKGDFGCKPFWLRVEKQQDSHAWYTAWSESECKYYSKEVVQEAEQKIANIRQSRSFMPQGKHGPMVCMVQWNEGGCTSQRCKHAHRYGPVVHLPYFWSQGEIVQGQTPVVRRRYKAPAARAQDDRANSDSRKQSRQWESRQWEDNTVTESRVAEQSQNSVESLPGSVSNPSNQSEESSGESESEGERVMLHQLRALFSNGSAAEIGQSTSSTMNGATSSFESARANDNDWRQSQWVGWDANPAGAASSPFTQDPQFTGGATSSRSAPETGTDAASAASVPPVPWPGATSSYESARVNDNDWPQSQWVGWDANPAGSASSPSTRDRKCTADAGGAASPRSAPETGTDAASAASVPRGPLPGRSDLSSTEEGPTDQSHDVAEPLAKRGTDSQHCDPSTGPPESRGHTESVDEREMWEHLKQLKALFAQDTGPVENTAGTAAGATSQWEGAPDDDDARGSRWVERDSDWASAAAPPSGQWLQSTAHGGTANASPAAMWLQSGAGSASAASAPPAPTPGNRHSWQSPGEKADSKADDSTNTQPQTTSAWDDGAGRSDSWVGWQWHSDAAYHDWKDGHDGGWNDDGVWKQWQ